MELTKDYWDARYRENRTGWDLKKASTPLVEYFEQLSNKELKILIPGGGFNYEAEYLFRKGFNNIFVNDFSETALETFRGRVPDFPSGNLIHANFFDLNEKFDLIIEQTFFCALNPSLREDYVLKMSRILKENGKLVGLLFNRHFENSPPFGGDQKEYVSLFQNYFNLSKLELCYNSEIERQGTELFINFVKM